VASNPLAFGPTSITLFGVLIPVFPALAGMLSVYLARLIAPTKERHFTRVQNAALVGLLLLVELAAITQFRLTTAKATLVGMMLGWMGLLVPEKGALIIWDWFKLQVLVALGGTPKATEPKPPASTMAPAERLRIAQKIYAKVWPTEAVPQELDEIIDKLKKL
jgi:hypothetical protein